PLIPTPFPYTTLFRSQVHVDVQGRVHRGPDQRVAGRVHTDGLDQVVEGDDGAGALRHAHGLAIADEVHHLADHDLNLLRVIAQGCRGCLQAGDVAVVIRTQHVNAQVVAAVDLIRDVGNVAGDVGGVAVGLDDDAVLVVAEVAGAQPPGPVGFVEVAVGLQLFDGLVHRAGFEEGVLVEEDVELGAELLQGGLDVVEHQLHALGAEELLGIRIGELAPGRVRLGDLGCDVLDVLAAIAVFRGGLIARGGEQRLREAVDLATVVVEVVLAGHLAALSSQQATQGVADSSPAGTTQVDRAGGVSRDEFQVDLRALVGISTAEILASGENVLHDLALRGGGQADIDEARAGDAGLVNLRA